MIKFRAEVLAVGERSWAGNALRFDSKDEALDYARDLAGRWMLVDKYRAVTDDTPERQPYVAGSEDGTA